MYDVTLTLTTGTVHKVMTWQQVRRYLPGGKLYGTVVRAEVRRVVR